LPEFLSWDLQPNGPLELDPGRQVNLIINYRAQGVVSGSWDSYILMVIDTPQDTVY
jgi:hypothetical protein